MSHTTNNTDLQNIADKIRADERLSYEDGVRLYESCDIHTLGELANLIRERRHGRHTFYNINRHINYTNYCVLRCKFCSFYRPYSQDGYELSIDEIAAQAKEASDAGATEVHIVGGLHPKLPFTYYLDMCRLIRQVCPALHIKAFTAIEIIHFARISRPKPFPVENAQLTAQASRRKGLSLRDHKLSLLRLTIREVLEQLREAGLDSLPGGGAEIFDERVHQEAFKNKVGQEGWFDVHAVAHEMGMYTNATMLYGHIERPHERIRHLIKLREHQDVSLSDRKAHFNCVVPLSFIPERSALSHLPGPTGSDDLRTLAITRLMLDNFAHVKAFWVMYTPKLAQVSLNWGVDDLDGTVEFYDITRSSAGGSTRQHLSVDQLRRLIRDADCIPVERDTLYQTVCREDDTYRAK